MAQLPFLGREKLRKLMRLHIEGREEDAARLLKETIMGKEAVAAEDAGLRMIKAGLMPSLLMTKDELGCLYSAYVSIATTTRFEGGQCREGSLQHVAMAFSWSKSNNEESDVVRAIGLWRGCLGQMQLARDREFDGRPDFDLAEYESALLKAECDHIVPLLAEADSLQEQKFDAEEDLKKKREIAKGFYKKVEEAHKELERGQPSIPCLVDFRITSAIWRKRWQECSNTIAKESAKARRRQGK